MGQLFGEFDEPHCIFFRGEYHFVFCFYLFKFLFDLIQVINGKNMVV
jgi:hypothetical protein